MSGYPPPPKDGPPPCHPTCPPLNFSDFNITGTFDWTHAIIFEFGSARPTAYYQILEFKKAVCITTVILLTLCLIFAFLPLIIPKKREDYINKVKLQISTKSGKYFFSAFVLAFINFYIGACVTLHMTYQIYDASDNQWVCIYFIFIYV